jgi:hypothetical protein
MVSPPPAENRTKENKRKMRIHATAKNRKIKKVKYKKFEPLRRIEPTPRKNKKWRPPALSTKPT